MVRTFVKHYDAIRSHPLLADATICYIFENNLGKEHDHLTYIVTELARFDNATVLFENEGVVGFHTTPASRLAADDLLQEKLTSGGLWFDESFFSINKDPSKAGKNAMNLVINQIADMKEYTKIMPNGECHRIVTSLFSDDMKKIRGKHDDCQRALSMLIWAERLFRTGRLPVDYQVIATLQRNRRVVDQGTRNIRRRAFEIEQDARGRDEEYEEDERSGGGGGGKRMRMDDNYEDY